MKRRKIEVDDINLFDDSTDNVNVVSLEFPGQKYWDIVGIKKELTEEGKKNIKLLKEGFLDKYCAKTVRKVKDCSHCIYFYDCLKHDYKLLSSTLDD